VVENRRKDDKPTWQKILGNIVLIGSTVSAIAWGWSIAGRYAVLSKTIDANAKVTTTNSHRLRDIEQELANRGPRIQDNKEEIDRLRGRK
jgi:hypothetical protein